MPLLRSRPTSRSGPLGRPLLGGPLLGWTRKSTPVYRLPARRLWLRRRRPMVAIRRGRRLGAGWLVRSRVAVGFGRPFGLLRQGHLPDAQQRAQRDQNTTQNQNASVSQGVIHQATSKLSGRKRPVVILPNAVISSRDRQTTRPLSWSFQPTFLRIITGSPDGFVNVFSDRRPFFAPISVHFLHLILALDTITGAWADLRLAG